MFYKIIKQNQQVIRTGIQESSSDRSTFENQEVREGKEEKNNNENIENKESVWVIFFHGFMGGHQDWAAIYPIVGEYANMLLLDLPGHGNSPWLDNLASFEKFSDEFEFLCRELKIETMILVGYSLGGRLAAFYASKYPNRIKKLILESAHLGFSETQLLDIENQKKSAKKMTMDRIKLIETQSMVDFVKKWYQSELFNISGKNLSAKALDLRVNQNKSNMINVLRTFSIEKQVDLIARLYKASFDIYYICGKYDIKYVELGKQYKKICKNLVLHVINDADHNVHGSNPLRYGRLLNEILYFNR